MEQFPRFSELEPGHFWARQDQALTQEQATELANKLRDMPVEGTHYLIDGIEETFISRVPYRWRN